MSNALGSKYEGRSDQRAALRAALASLHANRVSDQRVADLLGRYLSEDRIPSYPSGSTAPVSRPTVQRVRSATDQTLASMRPATIGLLYNFLCQCEELGTALYDAESRIHSSHALAPLLEALESHLGAREGPLTYQALRSLEGTFHLFRKAWTSPNADTYIQCILRLEWVGDALFYTEQQNFHDTVAQIPVEESDHGVVLPFGMNAILIGRGEKKALLKFFSVHDFSPFPDGHLKVHAFAGNFIAVYSKGPHPGFRGYALRVDPKQARCGFFTEEEMDRTILAHLTVQRIV